MAQWEKHFLCKHDQSSDPQNSRECWVDILDHLPLEREDKGSLEEASHLYDSSQQALDATEKLTQ